MYPFEWLEWKDEQYANEAVIKLSGIMDRIGRGVIFSGRLNLLQDLPPFVKLPRLEVAAQITKRLDNMVRGSISDIGPGKNLIDYSIEFEVRRTRGGKGDRASIIMTWSTWRTSTAQRSFGPEE